MVRFVRSLAAVSLAATALVFGPAASAQAPTADHGKLVAENQVSWGLKDRDPGRAMTSFEGSGWALGEQNGRVFVGGLFKSLENRKTGEARAQSYLTSFDTKSAELVSEFAPTLDGGVFEILGTNNNMLFVGGEFNTWNGEQVGALVRVDSKTGVVDANWKTQLVGGTRVVRDITLGSDGKLYVVGSFTEAYDTNGRLDVQGAVRLDPVSGELDRTWVPQLNTKFQGVWGVDDSKTNDTVYLAGKSIPGTPGAQGMIGVSRTDATITWNSLRMNQPSEEAHWLHDVIAVENGSVFAAGEQHGLYILDEANNMEIRKMHITGFHSQYQVEIPGVYTHKGGDFQSLTRVGNRIYATCHCWGSHVTSNSFAHYPGTSDLADVQGVTYTGNVNTVIAYDINSGERDQSLNIPMTGTDGAWATLVSSDGCLWAAGQLESIGDAGFRRGAGDLVRVCGETAAQVAVSSPAQCKVTTSVAGEVITWEDVSGATSYQVFSEVTPNSFKFVGDATDSMLTDVTGDVNTKYAVAATDGARLSIKTKCLRVAAPVAPAPVKPAPVAPVEPAPVAPVEPAPVAPVEPAPVAPVEPAPVAPVQPVKPAPVENTTTTLVTTTTVDNNGGAGQGVETPDAGALGVTPPSGGQATAATPVKGKPKYTG